MFDGVEHELVVEPDEVEEITLFYVLSKYLSTYLCSMV